MSNFSMHVVYTLANRAWRGTFADKGRLVDLLIFPVTHLLLWGIFLIAELVPHAVATQLFVINLIWAISATIQMQANRMMMFDLWAREFPELFRTGIRPTEYLVSLLWYGTVAGLFNIIAFVAASALIFNIPFESLLQLFITFPIYYIASIGLACLIAGIVIRLSQTYGFLAWNLLAFIIMLSSPYAPLERLPAFLRGLAYISPFTWTFEFVRQPRLEIYALGLLLSSILFSGGLWLYFRMFTRLRQTGEIMSI